MSGRLVSQSAKTRVLFAGLLVLTMIVMSGTAAAQVLYGSITGTVTDQSGAVVPNVTVLITNQSTGAVRSVVANGQGDYALRDVVPDAYQVSVQPSGNFAGFTQKNIQVNVNREVRVDVTLQLGSVAQEITVNTAPPDLQTDTAEAARLMAGSRAPLRGEFRMWGSDGAA